MSWLKRLLPKQTPPANDLPDFMADYIHFRKTGRALSTKIIKSDVIPFDPKVIAKRMGILEGKQLILEGEQEMDAMMDFGLQDIKVADKSHFQRYAELGLPDTTPDEYVVMDARNHSFMSLYQITNADSAACTVHVIDLLNKNAPLQFQEIGLSQTGKPGSLIFTRLLPFPNFLVTGGVSFIFNPIHKDRLIKGYNLLKFKANGKLRSDQTFLYFFRQNRLWGEQMMHIDVG